MSTLLYQQIRRLLEYGLDMLFPPRCAGCRRIGNILCPACIKTMQPLNAACCQHCGVLLPSAKNQCPSCRPHQLALHGLRSVHPYEGSLRNAIYALKYQGQQRLAEPLGLLMAEAFIHYRLRADAIVPLPLHPQRQYERGYNQAALLARVCARQLRIPCLEQLVVRLRATRAQVGLNANQRKQNVAGAFALAPEVQIPPRAYHTIVLIDDVCTTGATLEACALPLYNAGIQEIQGLVLARPTYST